MTIPPGRRRLLVLNDPAARLSTIAVFCVGVLKDVLVANDPAFRLSTTALSVIMQDVFPVGFNGKDVLIGIAPITGGCCNGGADKSGRVISD